MMSTVMAILAKLGTMLLTEAMMKRLLIVLLEAIVKRTEWEGDNKLLEEIKREWGLNGK